MLVTREQIKARYCTLPTEELLAARGSADLTELAKEVLEEILTERGVSAKETLAQFLQDLPKERLLEIGENVELSESARQALTEALRKKEIPEELPAVDPRLIGIRGWLILPAIGLVLSAIAFILGVVGCLSAFSRTESFLRHLWALEFLVDLILLAYLLYVMTRFFGKKRNTPLNIILYYLAQIFAAGLFYVMESYAGLKEIAAGTRFAPDIFWSVIWIFYFRVSKRVKATFIN